MSEVCIFVLIFKSICTETVKKNSLGDELGPILVLQNFYITSSSSAYLLVDTADQSLFSNGEGKVEVFI